MLTKNQIDFFKNQGYLVFRNLLTPQETRNYLKIYNQILDSTSKNSFLRSDLSGNRNNRHEKESITQVMLPSTIETLLRDSVLYQKTSVLAKNLFGDDMAFDFDMLINKPPHTSAITPWHQDEAYWIDMPDKRAISIWVALDKATIDNGCMWYVPKSHLNSIRKHTQKVKNGPLCCPASEKEAIPTPLNSGDCVMHSGATIHYSRGNISSHSRRAYILNYRPKAMVEFERAEGFDHSGKRKNRTKIS